MAVWSFRCSQCPQRVANQKSLKSADWTSRLQCICVRQHVFPGRFAGRTSLKTLELISMCTLTDFDSQPQPPHIHCSSRMMLSSCGCDRPWGVYEMTGTKAISFPWQRRAYRWSMWLSETLRSAGVTVLGEDDNHLLCSGWLIKWHAAPWVKVVLLCITSSILNALPRRDHCCQGASHSVLQLNISPYQS